MSADPSVTEAPPEDEAAEGQPVFNQEIPEPSDVPDPEPAPRNPDDLVPDSERSDADRLTDEPTGPITLASGTQVELKPLKLREFLKLLKIITSGGANILGELDLDTSDPAAFAQTMMMVVGFSIPEAEDETIEFVQAITKPAKKSTKARKQDRVLEDTQLEMDLIEELENPELEDMLDIISALVRAESKDLTSLGKKLMSMVNTAQKIGQLPT